ncbi:MAG: methyltransferase domain-containing protein [Deltaproteobacteria bacterium]|jgi:SAM-dependent methyltransferase|nr:methyltransferase domain-containing protein [Deltaproteobacteria bacterium]
MQADWLRDKKLRLERKNAFDGSLVFGTSKFNKDTGRHTRSLQPFQTLIDKDTGLIGSDLVRPRNCPVCGERPGPGLFIKDGFRHVRCPKCGLIYVSLILREDIMIKYWREETAWLSVLHSTPQTDMDRLKYRYGLDLAESFLEDGKKHGKLLDIGAGAGDFVLEAKERGWDASALELNLETADYLEREGIQVIVKPLELTDFAHGAFTLITMWEVLEHLTDPKNVLIKTREILSDKGLLLIVVPNAGSLVTRILHEKSNTFGGHSHLNHFNTESLCMLLSDLKYEVVDMETIITELGTINNYLDFQDPYIGEAKEFWPVITPELIHDKLWGSRLLVLAKKKL